MSDNSLCIVILLVIAVLVLLLAVVYYGVLRYFFNFAFSTKNGMKVPTPGQGTEYENLVTSGKNWLNQNDKEQVTCLTFDGINLVGHFYHKENAKAVLIFFHGWRGIWDWDFAPFVSYFKDKPFNMLVVEQRGHGKSDGKYTGMGTLECKDVLTWIKWYISNKENLYGKMPIYIMGVSMGASTVLMSLKYGVSEYVSGIISDCGFNNGYSMFKDYGYRKFHIPEFPLVMHLNSFAKRKIGVDLKGISTIDEVKECNVPILFVHGAADKFVLCDNTKKAYEACNGEKRLLLVENAGHCMSFMAGEKEYIDCLNSFFNFS